MLPPSCRQDNRQLQTDRADGLLVFRKSGYEIRGHLFQYSMRRIFLSCRGGNHDGHELIKRLCAMQQ